MSHPVPTALKILRGNPGQKPLNKNEPQPSSDIDLKPPDLLDDDGRAEWTRVAPILHRMGVLTEADTDALLLYCQTFARYKEAERNLRKYGMIVKSGQNRPMISPYLEISNTAHQQCRTLLEHFGCTPAARSRVTVVKRGGADKKRERFFGADSKPV